MLWIVILCIAWTTRYTTCKPVERRRQVAAQSPKYASWHPNSFIFVTAVVAVVVAAAADLTAAAADNAFRPCIRQFAMPARTRMTLWAIHRVVSRY